MQEGGNQKQVINYPWDQTEKFSLPNYYVNMQCGHQEDIKYFRQIALKAKAPGCSCLIHNDDKPIEYIDQTQQDEQN